MAQIARVVAVGASNLTRGIHTVLVASRTAWGPDVQGLAALGHGRSYGATSRVLVRTLPGILECGLWRTLEALPPVPTRAIVTDVGNDILYGCSAGQILAWVEETVARLLCITPAITLTGLPLASIRGLSREKYLAFRSVLFPPRAILTGADARRRLSIGTLNWQSLYDAMDEAQARGSIRKGKDLTGIRLLATLSTQPMCIWRPRNDTFLPLTMRRTALY